MSWVVYTLCVPWDNHEATDDSGSYFYCLFTFRLVYDETAAPLPTARNAVACACRYYTHSDTSGLGGHIRIQRSSLLRSPPIERIEAVGGS